MNLADNVFRQHNIKMSNRNRIQRRRAVQKQKEGRRWGTYWARQFYKRCLSSHVRHILKKLKYDLRCCSGHCYLDQPQKTFIDMGQNMKIRAAQNIKKNKRRGRIYDNQGQLFKEHKQRQSWYRIVKNPIKRILDTLQSKARIRELRFAFSKIELFSRYQKH